MTIEYQRLPGFQGPERTLYYDDLSTSLFPRIKDLGALTSLIILAPGGECEGSAFWSVYLSVCMSVQARNSKTFAQFDLIFLYKKCYPRGSVLL